mmetsp:Transcript_2993/g.6899  ORF Transcript_2993/g.6899 Transcript_2993/m.6899 type:complete len:404 (+) Transcript_2993:1554-2765(+)
MELESGCAAAAGKETGESFDLGFGRDVFPPVVERPLSVPVPKCKVGPHFFPYPLFLGCECPLAPALEAHPQLHFAAEFRCEKSELLRHLFLRQPLLPVFQRRRRKVLHLDSPHDFQQPPLVFHVFHMSAPHSEGILQSRFVALLAQQKRVAPCRADHADRLPPRLRRRTNHRSELLAPAVRVRRLKFSLQDAAVLVVRYPLGPGGADRRCPGKDLRDFGELPRLLRDLRCLQPLGEADAQRPLVEVRRCPAPLRVQLLIRQFQEQRKHVEVRPTLLHSFYLRPIDDNLLVPHPQPVLFCTGPAEGKNLRMAKAEVPAPNPRLAFLEAENLRALVHAPLLLYECTPEAKDVARTRSDAEVQLLGVRGPAAIVSRTGSAFPQVPLRTRGTMPVPQRVARKRVLLL